MTNYCGQKVKWIVMANCNGITKQWEYPVYEKAEALALFKNLALRYRLVKFISVDSEDDTEWYDVTETVIGRMRNGKPLDWMQE